MCTPGKYCRADLTEYILIEKLLLFYPNSQVNALYEGKKPKHNIAFGYRRDAVMYVDDTKLLVAAEVIEITRRKFSKIAN